MKFIKRLSYILTLVAAFFLFGEMRAQEQVPPSTKKERNHITKGNKDYNEGKYRDALKEYQAALQENPESQVARYNVGLTQINLGANQNDTTAAAKQMLENGLKNMQQIANLGTKRPSLASKANYNLGNVAYNSEDYQKAIDYYKQALRLNPDDDKARKNLRLAQLKMKNQDQDKDKDQNQDKDKDKDKEEQQEQEQNQDQQNQDQNQDKQDEKEEQQDPQSLNQQTAEQILNAIENKENQTRAKVAGQNAEKSQQRNRNRRNW